MDQSLVQVGLPAHCAFGDCDTKGFVKPHTDYGGWYKSKMFRKLFHKRWFCPEHYEEGRTIDNKFYKNYLTPDPYPAEEIEATQDKLYKLLED